MIDSLTTTDSVPRIAGLPESPQARFAAATLLAIPPEVRQALRDAVAMSLDIPIDGYGPDVDAVDPAKQAAYDSDVDDLFDCWVRKHVFDSTDDRLFRQALRLPSAEALSGSWS
ncbi:MAG TPA: hypothetical protein VGH67_10310 [Solirubrobacteraceae bacterium]|jgi:hypothetical protein